jgi:class 3 adenylate cyclase/tetratricopeptide (TPR) repeat protein
VVLELAMKCPACQIELPSSSKFCNQCGTRLEFTCPGCGQSIPPDSGYCDECGYDLEDSARVPLLIHQQPHSYTPRHLIEKILTSRSAIEGERKLVTVMFADVAGFTGMGEKLDPEDLHLVMNNCFRVLMDEVHKCEGTINEFRGDGVMALFGAPIAHEDHAVRACHASLAIQRALVFFAEAVRARYGVDFKMRIGLNSGPVVVGAIGDDLRMDYTAQGDTANLAARMEGSAHPGAVLVSANTWKLVKNLFEFAPMEEIRVKGKEQPVASYMLKGVLGSGSRAEREVYSEIIGRDQELSILELQLLKVVNGQGSVINIVGEAGVGKSRLIAELKKRDVAKEVVFLQGRAISIGKNLSFHPIIDLLKTWAGIGKDDPAIVATDKLKAEVRQVCSDQADEIFPFLSKMMGMKLSGKHAERINGITGQPLENLILKSVRDLAINASRTGPLVIVMEDLQWADTSSMLLLDALYRLAMTQQIVFINLYRPGYWDKDDKSPATLKTRAPDIPFIQILVQPLDPVNSETLIDNMLKVKGLQHPVKKRMIERAGGNPFFIEEIVRSFIDQGVVRVGENGLEVTDTIHSVVIPATINDLLMARIDRLDDGTREIVKVASVIGRSFFFRILADIVNRLNTLEKRLSYLTEIELLIRRMRMEELEYVFKHALAQEAAYGSSLLQQRRELHLKVAEATERIFSEKLHEFYGILAFHYSRAESPQKAEEYLIKAGEQALNSSASNEALYYYQEALRIYQKLQSGRVDPEKVAMLEKNIAFALFNRGRYTEAVEHFDNALNYYWGELPKNALSTAVRFLSGFTTFLVALYFPFFWFKKPPTHRDTQAVELFYKKAEALVVIDPKRFFIESFFFYDKLVHFDLTKFKMGIAVFAGASVLFSFIGLSLRIGRRILDYAKPKLPLDDAKQMIIYDLLDTQHLFLKGRWDDISGHDEELVKRSMRIGETFFASQHYYWHGLRKIYQGNFDTARLMVTRLSEIAEAYENDIYHLLKYLLSIHLLIECRHIKEAIDAVNQGIELVEKNGWAQSALTMHSLKALAHLLGRETERAREELDKASQIRSAVKAAPIQLSFFYRSQFEYYLRRMEDCLRSDQRKDPSEYRGNAFQAGKMLIKTCRKAALYRTDSYRLMGIYKWLISDRRGASRWWNEAIREGEDLGAVPQLARTYAEMGIRSCAINGEPSAQNLSRAKEPLKKAKTMFRDLGLEYDLKNLDSAISRTGLDLSEI